MELFHLRNSNSAGPADLAFGYGVSTDTPLIGDWDGNGVDTVGIYRNGAFYSGTAILPVMQTWPLVMAYQRDTPVVGDWDGNGVDTVGIYRNGVILPQEQQLRRYCRPGLWLWHIQGYTGSRRLGRKWC